MKLTILSTSDTHGFVLPTDYTAQHQDLPFGLARAKTALQRLQQAAPGPVLTIENGDWLQGSALAYYAVRIAEDPALLTQAYNQMGYDAGIIGNHEFNYGQKPLKAALASLQYPILAANILHDGQPAFGSPYKIFNKDGVKIAVLGLTTSYIPHWERQQNITGLDFVDAVRTAQHWVPKLKKLADVVVIAYHGGFERDLKTGAPTEKLTGENVAYALTEVPGVDALVTGHQHRRLSGIVNGVPITQPGYRGEKIGVITLDLMQTKDGYKSEAKSAMLAPVAQVPADAKMLETMADADSKVQTWLDEPLGHVTGDMSISDAFLARVSEHPYIEFIQKVQMAATDTDISGTALFNNKGKGFGSQISMRDVMTNYIYPNTLAVERLSGADLKAALEQNAEYFSLDASGRIIVTPRFEHPKPQDYNYDMYEGLTYILDITQPVGQRVTKLLYHDQPVQAKKFYDVVMNTYRAGGGGNFAMFSHDKIIRENQKDMTELIADYLQAHPQIQATANHNFEVLPKM